VQSADLKFTTPTIAVIAHQASGTIRQKVDKRRETYMSQVPTFVARKIPDEPRCLATTEFILAVLVLLVLPTWSFATVTIRNFDGFGTAIANHITRFDIDGNAIDAHDGGIYQFGSKFYRYGTSYGCGFRWLTAGAFCGFKSYSSSDLVNWQDEGFLFDPNDALWQSRCNGATSGCFRPRVIYNAAPAVYTWSVQVTVPDTTITSTNINRTTAIFKFASTVSGSTFACALDSSSFQTCTSPQNYNGLTLGTHTFKVYAVDRQGNADPTPASITWTASR
jgi:hypothetical protein